MPAEDDHPDKIERFRQEKLLDIAGDVRKFEIELFWKRSTFFWTFIAASFVAYATLKDHDQRLLRFAVSCFGIVCSLAWTLGNRGNKYWQEAWEKKLRRHQEGFLGVDLFLVLRLPTNGAVFGIRGVSRYQPWRLR
ncbi:hypothetical protein [uncultured Enterovirga sp.]|uniref:RipA family octameric membrane protein n=1 Tax=uncultured Enterovirga sp. TaxID=2026352 RepID=UPI0035CBDF94